MSPLDAAGSLPTLRLPARSSPWFKAREWATSQPMARWHSAQYMYIYIYTYGEISGDVTYDIYTYLIHGDSLSRGNIP